MLGSKKSPSYKAEYELYKILFFSLNQFLVVINVIYFILKYGQIFNILLFSSITLSYIIINFYFGLKRTIVRQILVFLNIVILQFLFLEFNEKINLFLPKILSIELTKPDILLIFFVGDFLLLLLFYYLNTLYPPHIYEKEQV